MSLMSFWCSVQNDSLEAVPQYGTEIYFGTEAEAVGSRLRQGPLRRFAPVVYLVRIDNFPE